MRKKHQHYNTNVYYTRRVNAKIKGKLHPCLLSTLIRHQAASLSYSIHVHIDVTYEGLVFRDGRPYLQFRLPVCHKTHLYSMHYQLLWAFVSLPLYAVHVLMHRDKFVFV